MKFAILLVILAASFSQGLRADTFSLDQGGVQFDLPADFSALTDQRRERLMPTVKGFEVKVLRDMGSPVVVVADIMRFSTDEAGFEKGQLGVAAMSKLMGDGINLVHNDYTLINGTRWLYTDIIRKQVRTVILQTRYRGRLTMVMAVVPASSFAQYKSAVTAMAMSLKIDPTRAATDLPYVEFDPTQDSFGLLQ